MIKFFYKTKEVAREALIESVKAFYILIAIMLAFTVYVFFKGSDLSAAVLVFQAGSFFIPTVIVHKKSSRVASAILLFLVLSNSIGLFMSLTASFAWVLNAGFILVVSLLALRMLLASITIHSRDTIDS